MNKLSEFINRPHVKNNLAGGVMVLIAAGTAVYEHIRAEQKQAVIEELTDKYSQAEMDLQQKGQEVSECETALHQAETQVTRMEGVLDAAHLSIYQLSQQRCFELIADVIRAKAISCLQLNDPTSTLNYARVTCTSAANIGSAIKVTGADAANLEKIEEFNKALVDLEAECGSKKQQSLK